ncbi:hypothetical protein R1sor_015553 [Riccia sorocarpa]|uniref:Uncharacterized protein n=1 Tax=Riccia sorocarpa TaxID=122646 RepID=A0ABD3HGH6_9MARC
MQEWVTEWDFRSLVLSPTGVQSVHDITLADEFHAGADHEVLSDTLAVEDVFAVKESSDEEAQTEYWLLRCTGKGSMMHGVGRFDRAEDVVSYCREYLTTGSTDQIKRVFWEVKETDVRD